MKTRSNMPLYVVECSDITALSNSQIDLLRCGDYLVKKTGEQEHAYKVTYKQDGVGMCLTYHDASCVETVSYDFTGGQWVYNSTDKADLPINVEDASFKPIYWHGLNLNNSSLKNSICCHVLKNDDTAIDNISKFKDWIEGISGNVLVECTGVVNISGNGRTVYALRKASDNTYSFYYATTTGYASITVDLYDYFNACNDDTNKIN